MNSQIVTKFHFNKNSYDYKKYLKFYIENQQTGRYVCREACHI
jgi:hypothetical protein